MIYRELGFPIVLLGATMVEVWGERVPDINLRDFQGVVLAALRAKPSPLTKSEADFVRKCRYDESEAFGWYWENGTLTVVVERLERQRDEVQIPVDAETYDRFVKMLDAPTKDDPRLERLMTEPSVFEDD